MLKIKHKNPDAINKVLSNYKRAGKVAIGFPSSKVGDLSYPTGESVVEVAIKNNFGFGNVRRRDFMTPAGVNAVEKTKPITKAVVQNINSGNVDIEAGLKQMGDVGAGEVSNAIIDLKDPGNSEATKAAKGSSNPLVGETGLLSKSPTWAFL